MSDPYLGQITCTAFDYPPNGYARCDGTQLQVTQNQGLFALIGVKFGGNGQTTFCLPDLRGRTMVGQTAIGVTPNYALGTQGGWETVALTSTQVPPHAHSIAASTNAGTVGPAGAVMSSVGPSTGSTYPLYTEPTGTLIQLTNPVSVSGANAGHPNMQPFAVVAFAIATIGTWPPRS